MTNPHCPSPISREILQLSLESPSPTSFSPMAACGDAVSTWITQNPSNQVEVKQCQIKNLDRRTTFKLCGPSFLNLFIFTDSDKIWSAIREEARSESEQEPILYAYYCSSILVHDSLEEALANHLAEKLCTPTVRRNALLEVFLEVFCQDGEISRAIREDLKAVKERDPAFMGFAHCLLHLKGFLACQAHRVAHRLWSQGRKPLALLVQSRVSEVFAVDIHPGAKIGSGVLLDHATGIVIGETAAVGDNVSILHSVTLGGTGKVSGDRHPKIGNGVMIGAGSMILGNVVIGEGAKIGAGSLVLKEVPSWATAVGNPARVVAAKR